MDGWIEGVSGAVSVINAIHTVAMFARCKALLRKYSSYPDYPFEISFVYARFICENTPKSQMSCFDKCRMWISSIFLSLQTLLFA